MGKGVDMRWRPLAIATASILAASCSSSSGLQTLASLHSVQPDVDDVEVDDSLQLALNSYRSYLEETPTTAMTPEAMRRLADLQIEREFGITGTGERWLEMPAPTSSDIPSSPVATAEPEGQPAADAESDDEFERRATEQYRFAEGEFQAVPAGGLSAPGTEGLSGAGPLEAIAIYKRLLEEYPSYERSDQVLYQMARAYDELGMTEDSMAVTQRLIDEYGYSKYVDEVQFRRGEYFFTRRMYRDAENAYQSVVDLGAGSEFFELALYKLGWTLFKQDFYEEALHRYMALLDYKLSIGYDFDAEHAEEDERRVADTFRVISLSFSNLGGPEVIGEYYSTYGARSYEDRIYKNLAEFYFDKLRYNDAATVYESFVERYPFHRVSPEFSMRVIGIYDAGGFPMLVVESKKDFARKYGLEAEYWRHFDVAERPEVAQYLKTNLHDLANYYHALYQEPTLEEEKGANYAEALVWYRQFLRSFPQDEESPGINYQLADLLLENEDFGEAAREYERTAYEYPTHERASAAGYAAIFAHREELKRVDPEHEDAAKRATVASSLRFADTFPEHEYAPVVLGAAAEDLYAMQEYSSAAIAGRALIERYPAGDPALRRSAWEVVAHSSFELEDYVAAEPAYERVLELTPADDPSRAKLVDNLAASIYKQGEQANEAEDYQAAADTFLRIKQVAPTSEIRPAAEYDAAAALMRLEDWNGAARVLDEFRQAFPDHELQKDATKQLALVYTKGGETSLAAAEYERVAGEAASADQRAAALLEAGDLYEQSNDDDGALRVYERYVAEFTSPVDVAIETRSKIATMYKAKGNLAEYEQALRELVAADAAAGSGRTDRTRYLAAQAGLVLAEPLFAQFEAVKLVQPFEQSLARKRDLMDSTLQTFENLAGYEVGDVTAAATYYMAEIYYDFSRSLLESERPTGMSAAESAEYEEVLEEEAFPFEERAIDVHEKNLELASSGVYNRWIESSLGKLASLVPGRYAKEEQSSEFIASLDDYTYRLPSAPPPVVEAVEAEPETGKRGRSAQKKPTAGLEVLEGTGFTYVEKGEADESVRAEFDRAVVYLEAGQFAAAVPILIGVAEKAPEFTAPQIDLGIAYARSGDLDQAAAALEKAIEIDARQPIAYNELGLVYRRQGRLTLARQTYERGLTVYPALHLARRNLAILCDLYLRDRACAIDNYEAYRQVVPDDKDAGMWIDDLRGRGNP